MVWLITERRARRDLHYPYMSCGLIRSVGRELDGYGWRHWVRVFKEDS